MEDDDRRQQGAPLRDANDVDPLKSELLAFVAHEIRTPLAVIVGFAQNLRESWDGLAESEKLAAVEAILRNGRTVTRLVEEDLQVALIEAGGLSYTMAPFDLAAVTERTVEDFARTSRGRFELRYEEALPPVWGDEMRSSQVVANLLSNAVKFSGDGVEVQVDVSRDGVMVQVAIRDRGTGIRPEDVPSLFRKFSRLEAAHADTTNGTGVGLFLAKSMIEAQRGSIWVDSKPGEGSAFCFTLPVARTRPDDGRP